MYSINATELKNRLGPVLARAALEPVAILRHGRVVAVLSPPGGASSARRTSARRRNALDRREEERLVRLCASGDLRPSRWKRAGDRRMLAGVATMLASQPEFDRMRLLSLAEQLQPGITRPEEFGRWLDEAPVKAARLLPMVRREMARPVR